MAGLHKWEELAKVRELPVDNLLEIKRRTRVAFLKGSGGNCKNVAARQLLPTGNIERGRFTSSKNCGKKFCPLFVFVPIQAFRWQTGTQFWYFVMRTKRP
jgi:hypothetical protein